MSLSTTRAQQPKQRRKWPGRVSPAYTPSIYKHSSCATQVRHTAIELLFRADFRPNMSTSMSPRLPSPPPAAEIQMGPKSPGPGATMDEESQQMEQTVLNANSKRRIHPGTKSADMAAGPPMVPLNEVRSRCRYDCSQVEIFQGSADHSFTTTARLRLPTSRAPRRTSLAPHGAQHTAHHPRDSRDPGRSTPFDR